MKAKINTKSSKYEKFTENYIIQNSTAAVGGYDFASRDFDL